MDGQSIYGKCISVCLYQTKEERALKKFNEVEKNLYKFNDLPGLPTIPPLLTYPLDPIPPINHSFLPLPLSYLPPISLPSSTLSVTSFPHSYSPYCPPSFTLLHPSENLYTANNLRFGPATSHMSFPHPYQNPFEVPSFYITPIDQYVRPNYWPQGMPGNWR